MQGTIPEKGVRSPEQSDGLWNHGHPDGCFQPLSSLPASDGRLRRRAGRRTDRSDHSPAGKNRGFYARAHFGLFSSMYSGFMPLGMAVFGPLADHIPLRILMALSGAALIGLGKCSCAIKYPAKRRC